MFRLTTTKHLLLAIFDFIVIGIIIYGLTDWVYDGYPKWVPYVIMAFFLIMASVRFYKFSAELKKSNSLDSRGIESLFAEDETEDKQADEVSSNGFRRRSKNVSGNSDNTDE